MPAMRNLLLVMIGGGIGAGFRYHLGSVASRQMGPGFPWGTLIANLLGGFLAGLLAAFLVGEGSQGEPLRLFLAVGVLGGFTTFSAFSVEAMAMLQRGEAGLAGAYIISSVAGSLMWAFVGWWLVRAAA
jgi:CrcB protein